MPAEERVLMIRDGTDGERSRAPPGGRAKGPYGRRTAGRSGQRREHESEEEKAEGTGWRRGQELTIGLESPGWH